VVSSSALIAPLLLITLFVRLFPAWHLHNIVADIAAELERGILVLHGDNLYEGEFPYTPLPQFIPAIAIWLSEATGWSFDFAFKLPLILCDAGALVLLFASLRFSGVALGRTALWCLAWALNPVAILISAFHGNISSMVPFLVLASFVAAQVSERSAHRGALLTISALALGLAVALRAFPVFLVPVFLLLYVRTIREAVVFAGLAALPAALNCAPYLLYVRHTFLRSVLSYSGLTDFGWLSVLRVVAYMHGGSRLGPFDEDLLQRSKELFLVGVTMALLALPFFRRSLLGRALMLPPLLFSGLYGAVSAQYLVWVLPLALAMRDRLALAYTLVATTAMISFYVIYHPGIIFGVFPPLLLETPPVLLAYAGSNVALTALSLYWCLHIILSEVIVYRRTRREERARGVPNRRAWWRWLLVGALASLCVVWAQRVEQIIDRARLVLRVRIPAAQVGFFSPTPIANGSIWVSRLPPWSGVSNA
jgi:hypothetical protein